MLPKINNVWVGITTPGINPATHHRMIKVINRLLSMATKGEEIKITRAMSFFGIKYLDRSIVRTYRYNCTLKTTNEDNQVTTCVLPFDIHNPIG